MNASNLHSYQRAGIAHIINNPVTAIDGAGMFLDLGLGKTATALTAVETLLTFGDIKKPLVIAPLRVARHTWTDEIEKWDHLKHLRVSQILGDINQRNRALNKDADIYIINRDNIPWLVAKYGMRFPFDMVIIDELSSFKNPSAKRFKALRSVRPLIKRVVGLTGTPAPNGEEDLWSQIYLLDQGKRLEKNITGFRQKYMVKNPHSMFSKYEMREGDEEIGKSFYSEKIHRLISDICISMQAKDWLDLPKRVDITREVKLPDAIKKRYDDFEKEEVLRLTEIDEEISTPNAAALINKLLQFGNGAVYYDGGKSFYEVHNEKIEALGNELEAANGNPILVSYQFQSDVTRIKQHLKEFKPVHIADYNTTLQDWNAGKIKVLLGHAASMGHGLNMQHGGHLMTHFGVGWPLELYLQFVARLDRQGQKHSVINSRLICTGTYDPVVLARLSGKKEKQQKLMDAVKALIHKHAA